MSEATGTNKEREKKEMSSLMLFAAETCTSGGCPFGKCPPHAIVALAAALAIGFVIGFLVGRRRAAKGGAKPQQPQKKQQAPVRRDPRPVTSRPPIPAGSVELYVGNLSYDMTEDQLRQTFEAFGKVDSVRLVTNRYNNKSKGFAFVVMPNRPEAEKAIAEMNDKEVMGRPMRVNEAQNTNKAEA